MADALASVEREHEELMASLQAESQAPRKPCEIVDDGMNMMLGLNVRPPGPVSYSPDNTA